MAEIEPKTTNNVTKKIEKKPKNQNQKSQKLNQKM